MNKINWINGQAGGTPLSAENLNLMQTYIEDAINEVVSKMQGTTLYEDSTGTSGTVTFSQNITNAMKRIRISGYAIRNGINYYFTEDFDIVLNKNFGLFVKSYDGGINSYFESETITLNSTSITRGSQYELVFPNTARNDVPLYITKVIGYDY